MCAKKAGDGAKAVDGQGNNSARGEELSLDGDKRYTRADIAQFLSEIARSVVSTNTTYMHSMLALNQILRLPYAPEILDQDLKDQMRDLWLKVKSSGLQLVDPPLLFGDGVEIPLDYDLADHNVSGIDSVSSASSQGASSQGDGVAELTKSR